MPRPLALSIYYKRKMAFNSELPGFYEIVEKVGTLCENTTDAALPYRMLGGKTFKRDGAYRHTKEKPERPPEHH